jgi:hypothetical protein
MRPGILGEPGKPCLAPRHATTPASLPATNHQNVDLDTMNHSKKQGNPKLRVKQSTPAHLAPTPPLRRAQLVKAAAHLLKR